MALILVVEDEVVVSMSIEQLIGDLGHELLGSAASTAGALDLLTHQRPDAALLDIRLRGGETVYALAGELKTRRVPFALMTGYASEAIDPRYAAACVVLHKPFSASDLESTLKRLLV